MSARSSCAAMVAEALRRSGQGNAFSVPPAAWYCPEPVVCADADWHESSRQSDGSVHGTRRVVVTCCCDDPRDAEATCRGAALTLRDCEWGWAESTWGIRVARATVGPCGDAGRDASGRWLWRFNLDLTVVVEDA